MPEILLQDEFLVAIQKESGMLVHPSDLARDRITCMSTLRDQLKKHVYPVHRLDRATSGVLLFALNKEIASQICAQFANNQVQKRYLAIVRGHVAESWETDYALRETPHSSPADARTSFRCLSKMELPVAVGRYESARYSLVEASPHTGRHHQIRKHLKHVFHPIIGDTVHGDGRHNRIFRETFEANRLLLHALSLRFRHPVSGEEIAVHAPPTKDLERVLGLFEGVFSW